MNYSDRKRQRGMTLLMVALLLVVFMAIGAIAVDAGMLYVGRTAAQHAADAAALAGVYEFINPCNSITPPASCVTSGWDLVAAAENSAITMAAQNTVLGQPVVITTKFAASPCTGSATASWVCVDQPNRTVTAYVARTGGLGIVAFFSRVIGYDKIPISAMGTAQAGQANTETPTATSSYCLKPIFLPNTVLSSKPAGDACAAGEVIFNSDGTQSAWSKNNNVFGQMYDIRPTTPSAIRDGALLQPGQFFSLNFGTGQGGGAATYECTLGKCINECAGTNPNLLQCGTTNQVSMIDLETGNMVGPTAQGITQMLCPGSTVGGFALPPGCTLDTYDGPGGYTKREQPTTSVNLAAAPVWDVCNNLGTIPGGTQVNIQVLGFVKIFVDDIQRTSPGQGTVYAHVLEPIQCGQVATDTPTPPPPGPYAVPVRLVQNPGQSPQ